MERYSEAETLAREVCERHDLEVVRVIPNRSHAAFVAHARNDRGADILVKQGSSVKRTAREARANQRWSFVGAATFSTEIEPGVLIREFASGLTLKELPCFGSRYALEVGQLLARMHAVTLDEPGVFIPAADYINERYTKQRRKTRFAPAHFKVFRESCKFLLNADLGNSLVHGDLCAGNIMVADRRLYAFDARGFRGGAALDLIGYVMHIPRVDPLELLRDVLKGYGPAPTGLAATFAWRLIVSAASGRAHDSHRLLANRVAEAGSFRHFEELLGIEEAQEERRPRFPREPDGLAEMNAALSYQLHSPPRYPQPIRSARFHEARPRVARVPVDLFESESSDELWGDSSDSRW